MELEDYKKEIKNISYEELIDELEQVNMYIFMTDMIDRWTEDDKKTYEFLNKKNDLLEEEINGRNK